MWRRSRFHHGNKQHNPIISNTLLGAQEPKMPSATTVPSLQRVPFTDTEGLIKAVERDGGVIATGFTTTEVLDKVAADVVPYLEADKPWKVSCFIILHDEISLTIHPGRALPQRNPPLHRPHRPFCRRAPKLARQSKPEPCYGSLPL